MKDLNQLYFDILNNKYNKNEKMEFVLHQPEAGIESNIICLPLANEDELKQINIKQYADLSTENVDVLCEYDYRLVKMQAGLGSSVKRDDLINEVEGRTELGAKGTDLYFEIDGKLQSISKIQLLQANKLSEKSLYKNIYYQNLVNDQTQKTVENSLGGVELSSKCKIVKEYFQKKMPTISETGELTNERMAPAGHGFVGICEIVKTFCEQKTDELVSIGNGEDLCSTADEKITSWIVKNKIPVTMITTTKTDSDKKGGQISLVKGADKSYVTIVEKAQAEKSNQLEYFEQLGLREDDNESLFNTNIVVINRKALKEVFEKYIPNLKLEKFIENISPDVIQNSKEQDGKKFIQLESALGSVVLNLDKFFRLNFSESVVSFLNLSQKERTKFFMPIKKREDYELIRRSFIVDKESYLLVQKD